MMIAIGMPTPEHHNKSQFIFVHRNTSNICYWIHLIHGYLSYFRRIFTCCCCGCGSVFECDQIGKSYSHGICLRMINFAPSFASRMVLFLACGLLSMIILTTLFGQQATNVQYTSQVHWFFCVYVCKIASTLLCKHDLVYKYVLCSRMPS